MKFAPLATLLICTIAAWTLGCEEAKPADTKKAEGAAAESTEKTEGEKTEGAKPDEAKTAEEAPAEEAVAEVAATKLVHQPGAQVGEWTMCPIMKGKFEVKENHVSTDYNGTKVFFCCAGCEAKFLESPEAALTALNTEIDKINADNGFGEEAAAPAAEAVAQ